MKEIDRLYALARALLDAEQRRTLAMRRDLAAARAALKVTAA